MTASAKALSATSNNLAAESWAIADLLRGDFKQSQYGRIILPFALLRRLECVLAASKDAVLAEADKVATMKLPDEAAEKMLLRATSGPDGKPLRFYNLSKFDLASLGAANIEANLLNYIQGFSRDAREIFEHFKFAEFIGQLGDANLLFKVVQKVGTIDMNIDAVSNHDMGLVFEELIRRFAEGSNETAGEHFTPRDIVRLTTSLVFMEDDDALTTDGAIRTIYDPTAGTGGFLSSGEEYVRELNPSAKMVTYGQELNPESYAICKADMLIKGQEVNNIKLGNTLSSDHLYGERFDYMLSNPPFGVDWKKIEGEIKREHSERGFDGRFGPGLPRVSDGSLLFLLHLIAKLRDPAEGGGRIGIILNGSPLFTGGAGSGESEIRRDLLEQDLVEAIVALPNDMFYNTGIATYIWILSNHKSAERKGKVQLINASKLYGKMRKSLGSKRNEMQDEDIRAVTRAFGNFAPIALPEDDTARELSCKIFPTHAFGYRRLSIERPLRQSFQFSAERLAPLRFGPRALIPAQTWLYNTFAEQLNWQDSADCDLYGELGELEEDIRLQLKISFPELKESQVKDLFKRAIWQGNLQTLLKAQQLAEHIGETQFDDMNGYDAALKKATKKANITLDAKEKKAIETAVSWTNPVAEKVIKKQHKNTDANAMYGLFEVDGKVLEYKPDSDLRDNENIPLDPSRPVDEVNEAYVQQEVLPHVPDAWIDGSKVDHLDGQVGVVGYEIPFNRHFYVYKPPRSLEAIDADLERVSREIVGLLGGIE